MRYIRSNNLIIITEWDKILVKTQPEITCLKLKVEALEQGVKYVQS